MDQIVGFLTTAAVGVVGVAAIYQLSKGKAPLVKAGQSVANTTTKSLFKG